MAASAPQQHRTQASRSAATRGRILDAAFEALSDLGYANFSTSAVCRRAGVSRGTLLHHYGSTHELVTAAAEHVFLQQLDAYSRTFGALPEPERCASRAIAMLWSILSGPVYYAWLEIVVASRTDPALCAKVREVVCRFGEAVQEAYMGMFPVPKRLPFDPAVIPSIVFPLLNGLAIDKIHASPSDIDATLDLIQRLADLAQGWANQEDRES